MMMAANAHDWLSHLDQSLWLVVFLDWLPSCITQIHPFLRVCSSRTNPSLPPPCLPLSLLLLIRPSPSIFSFISLPLLYHASLSCFMYLSHHHRFSCLYSSLAHLPSWCSPPSFSYFSPLLSSPGSYSFPVIFHSYSSFPPSSFLFFLSATFPPCPM